MSQDKQAIGVGVIEVLLQLIQSNLNNSNTAGSFTVANSSSLFSHYEILPIAQENKRLRIFYFIMKFYAVCTR